MPVQLQRQQQGIGRLDKGRGSSNGSGNYSEPCSGWNDPDRYVAVWGELVTRARAQDSATTATPLVEVGSRRLLRHGERPWSCPGGRAGGTTSVPAGTASSRRLTSAGSRASDASSASVLGLGVYCTTIDLAVNKELHGRHSASKRPGSACRTSSSSDQAGSLPAWIPAASTQAGNSSSNVGSQRAGAASSSEGGADDKLAAGTGRAVGLALSLRERVMQLEKRNRALEKKLKHATAEERAHQDSKSKQAHSSSTTHAQQQQLGQAPEPGRLQVCVLHTADVPAAAKKSAGSSCSSSAAARSGTSSVALVIRRFEAALEDSSSTLDVSAAADCSSSSSKGQHSATAVQQQQQLQLQQQDAEARLRLQPPRTPDLNEAVRAPHRLRSAAAAAPPPPPPAAAAAVPVPAPMEAQAPAQAAALASAAAAPAPVPAPTPAAALASAAAAPALTLAPVPAPAAALASEAAAAAAPTLAPALAQAEHQALLKREQQQQQQVVASLQRQLSHMQMLHGLLQNDYADLEFVLKETERQRREYAARYAFVCLDGDGDGYLSVEQVEGYDLFACYAPRVLRAAFAAWRWASGFPGYLNIDDFVRFVEYAEDRSSSEAQRFWFNVLDTDGDGRLGWQDMHLAYAAVGKSAARFVVSFEDLMNQIRDMVRQQQQPKQGFTCAELRASKLGPGVLGLLTNHNNMLLQRSTAEWGRGEYPCDAPVCSACQDC